MIFLTNFKDVSHNFKDLQPKRGQEMATHQPEWFILKNIYRENSLLGGVVEITVPFGYTEALVCFMRFKQGGMR
ncbi:hypothetical protein [Sagittula sp. NFXS13]|uniref:hypothetical protein n=1 Tax=Sagittula sp. NFXS13 TaxID=2819095 RepID=UPI0032E03D17